MKRFLDRPRVDAAPNSTHSESCVLNIDFWASLGVGLRSSPFHDCFQPVGRSSNVKVEKRRSSQLILSEVRVLTRSLSRGSLVLYLIALSHGPRPRHHARAVSDRQPTSAAVGWASSPRPETPLKRTVGSSVGGNCKFPICGNRKPHTLVVGGGCPAFHDVDDVNNEGAGHRCMDGRRGCC